jgi:hypothetical protein
MAYSERLDSRLRQAGAVSKWPDVHRLLYVVLPFVSQKLSRADCSMESLRAHDASGQTISRPFHCSDITTSASAAATMIARPCVLQRPASNESLADWSIDTPKPRVYRPLILQRALKSLVELLTFLDKSSEPDRRRSAPRRRCESGERPDDGRASARTRLSPPRERGEIRRTAFAPRAAGTPPARTGDVGCRRRVLYEPARRPIRG